MNIDLIANFPAFDASSKFGGARAVGITVINFNTHKQTLRCLESLRLTTESAKWIFVLDNASSQLDYTALRDGICAMGKTEIRLYRSEINIGFAAGSNFLINQLLKEDCLFFGLFNNDAVAKPEMVSSLVNILALDPQRIGLAGGRMHKLNNPEQVDTLGICIYASLMPADRHSTDDPYLGPTGGCCMLARELIEHLLAANGYCFDERYFCYCEDTDLVLRANLLGYEPAYVDQIVALHEGQASSGGSFNSFIAYHGVRNAIWMQMKLMPAEILAKHGLLLIFANLMSIARHTFAGRGKLMFSIYRDAWVRRKEFSEERRVMKKLSKLNAKQLAQRFAPHFYRSGYARQVLGEIATHFGFKK